MQNVSEKQNNDTTERLDLVDIDAGQIAELATEKLRELCKAAGLKSGGKKTELVKRLLLKKTGQSASYAGTFTKCRICGLAVRVIGTSRKSLKGGRTLITRQIRCTGRHKHTYPLKEIISSN